jgi:hypothetical protein
MTRVPVNDEILAAAQELLKKPSAYRDTLRRIINGKVKSVDVDWWRNENGVTAWQVAEKAEQNLKARLDSIKAMADPTRNPSEHQRRVAEATFARMQAAGIPKALRMPSAPGLEKHDRQQAQRRATIRVELDAAFKAYKARRDAAMRNASVNTAKTKPTVNTTTARKPRTADRHLEPNRDRHRPGYMAEYMRRRRAAERKGR